LAAALVAGLGVALYRNRRMEQGEAQLRADEARNDGGGEATGAPAKVAAPD
jgi:hypothetical protein